MLLQNEIGHALDDRESLSCSGASSDERGSLGRSDGTTLLVVCIPVVEISIHECLLVP